MKRGGYLIILCSLLMLAAMPIQRASAEGFLHVRGQDLVDEKGHKILLRGVGLGNWLLPEGYMWQFGEQGDRPRRIENLVSDMLGPEEAKRFWHDFRKNYVTEKDVETIANLGFNSVRPALNARLFLSEGEKPVYIDEGFQLLDNLVGWCRKHHIYVIIDMHAAPGGQTGQNIDDSIDDQPALWSDRKQQDRLVDLWVKIATRYKDEPTVAGFDLLNEPLPQRTGAEAKFKDQLEPLYKRLTQAIRKVDKRHMITVEGADWANDWTAFSPRPFDDNLVYQFHYYCWNQPDHLNDINKYLDFRKKVNKPLWVGETGEKGNAIYWATTQYFEANNMGWSFWPWKKMETQNTIYSIKAPEGWKAVRAFSRGGAKPSPEVAQKAFDQLRENIRLENCVYLPDVAAALLRRVPGKVEAENFGAEGLGRSYSVKSGKPNSKFYRTSEPVNVEVIPGPERWISEQAIVLDAGEWTAYTIGSREAKEYAVTIRVSAGSSPGVLELSVNNQSQELKVSDNNWAEIKLKSAKLSSGENRIKLLAKSGTLRVDWLTFK